MSAPKDLRLSLDEPLVQVAQGLDRFAPKKIVQKNRSDSATACLISWPDRARGFWSRDFQPTFKSAKTNCSSIDQPWGLRRTDGVAPPFLPRARLVRLQVRQQRRRIDRQVRIACA
jgi:hypothetical protein